MNIHPPLQSFRRLGVCVRPSSNNTVATTGGGILSIQMIGIDILITEVLHGF
ncbi:MAG: hypothetical protein H7839_14630 [Magnetococcus sp. YQC-5]